VLVVLSSGVVQAQNPTPIVITPDNAGQVVELMRIGRGTIHTVEWAPDGQTIAAVGPVGVWLYDADNLSAEPRLLDGHTEDILAIAFSPDGLLLASMGADSLVQVWDLSTDMPRFTLTHPPSNWSDNKWVAGIAFSPDGTTLATSKGTGISYLWDVATGELLDILEEFCQDYTTALAYGPDGQQLACSTETRSDAPRGTVEIWDLSTRAIQRIAESVYSPPVTSLIYSPDGRYLAWTELRSTLENGQPIYLWDLENQIIQDVFYIDTEVAGLGHYAGSVNTWDDAYVYDVNFSADGSLLAAAGGNGLLIWDMTTNTVQDRLLPEQSLYSLDFNPVDGRLAYIFDNTLIIRDLAAGTEETLTHEHPITTIAFDPSGTTLVSGRSDGQVELWNISTGDLVSVLRDPDGLGVYQVAFSPSGSQIVVGVTSNLPNGENRLWGMNNDESGAIEVYSEGAPIQIETQILQNSLPPAFTFTLDGTAVVYSCTGDTMLHRWNFDTQTEQTVLDLGDDACAQGVAFSADGTQLIIAIEMFVQTWDVATGALLEMAPTNGTSLGSMALYNDQRALGVYQMGHGGGSSELQLWQGDTMTATLWPYSPEDGNFTNIFSVTFSSDGRLVAEANGNFLSRLDTVRLWDVETQTNLIALENHHSYVYSVVFSPDGTLLASGSADGTIRLWGIE
jgi:WD40 repeat protein